MICEKAICWILHSCAVFSWGARKWKYSTRAQYPAYCLLNHHIIIYYSDRTAVGWPWRFHLYRWSQLRKASLNCQLLQRQQGGFGHCAQCPLVGSPPHRLFKPTLHWSKSLLVFEAHPTLAVLLCTPPISLPLFHPFCWCRTFLCSVQYDITKSCRLRESHFIVTLSQLE